MWVKCSHQELEVIVLHHTTTCHHYQFLLSLPIFEAYDDGFDHLLLNFYLYFRLWLNMTGRLNNKLHKSNSFSSFNTLYPAALPLFFLLLIITKFKSSLDTYTQLSINILLGKPVQLFVIKYLIHQSHYSNSLHLGMYTSSRRLAEV